jgi:hypothetical protein
MTSCNHSTCTYEPGGRWDCEASTRAPDILTTLRTEVLRDDEASTPHGKVLTDFELGYELGWRRGWNARSTSLEQRLTQEGRIEAGLRELRDNAPTTDRSFKDVMIKQDKGASNG